MAISELRRDLITKRWVVIATERSRRPTDFAGVNITPIKEPREMCVFCPGNEEKTSPEISSFRNNGDLKWKVRVVPNRFGAFAIEGDLETKKDGMHRCKNGRGAHEVIVSTPDHLKNIYDFTADEMNDLLWMCSERILDLAKAVDENGEKKIASILIFGNEGAAAGATKEHAHWQLIGLPIVPLEVWNEIESGRERWGQEDECVFCKLSEQERRDGTLMVFENEYFFSRCAYAGRFPFETWIMPQNHRPLFEDGSPKSIRGLAEILMDILRRMGVVLKRVPFNIYLHAAPLHDRQHDRYYHFHVEIIPRMTNLAGFEFGTGFYINPMIPEDAARFLREAKT